MNEYATAAELKASISLSSETFADADISRALTAASRGVDNATDRRFWADTTADKVRYYTPTSDRVWIDDLVTLTTLEVDTGLNGSFSETWTVDTDFFLGPLNAAEDGWPYTSIRVPAHSSRWLPADYPRTVKVTGKYGWPAVPDTVKHATMIIASKLVKRLREAPFGVIGDGELAMRVVREDPEVQFLLNPYRRSNHF